MFLAKNKTLVEAFKAGDPDAMEEIYLHYAPGVERFLKQGFTFRSGGGHCYFKGIKVDDDLGNAVQEVFRRAFEERARNAYNGINSFTNWVLAISRNMVINQFRNREVTFSQYISASDDRGHLAVMDDAVTQEYSGILYGSSNKAPLLSAEHKELQALIQEFMSELNEQERKLLVMRFVDNMSQEDAASQLDSTRMKVRTSEAKLRRRLRAFLSNTGYLDNIGKKNEET